MAHPERPTEHETESAIQESLDEFFVVFCEEISDLETVSNNWQVIDLEYSDLEDEPQAICVVRTHPTDQVEMVDHTRFMGTVRIGADHDARFFLINDTSVEEFAIDWEKMRAVGTHSIDWEAKEGLLGRVQEALMLARNV